MKRGHCRRNQVARETLDQIRRCTAEIIGQFVSLKTSGASFKGLCPFHDDNNPSFLVKAEYFKCFACGIFGDVFKFVMLAENATFPESVRIAAEIAGVNVKDETTTVRATIEHERSLISTLADWREETLRTCAADLRKRDELIRYAKAGFDAALIDEEILFYSLGIAYSGYSPLEYWFWQLVRDDLFDDLELWRLAQRSPL
jgi:DNA primase